MPYYRVLKLGFSLATRAKIRSTIFVILFVLATTVSLLQLSRIYSYGTHDLLRLKGVVLEPQSPMRSDVIDEKLYGIYNDFRDVLSGIYIVYGLSILDNQLLVISVNTYRELGFSEEIRWAVSEFKPTALIKGRYIETKGEGIVNDGFYLNFTEYGTPLAVHLSVGDVLSFRAGYRELKIRIVGITSSELSVFKKVTDLPFENVLFVDWETFKDIAVDIKGLSGPIEESSQVYVLRVIFLVKGSVISALTSGDIFKYKTVLKEELSKRASTLTPLKIISIEEIIPQEYQAMVILFIVSVLFQMMVTGIYAILIIRFRRIDIATLRAIGWDSGHVKMFVIGEFLSILVIGFVIGIVAGGIYNSFLLRLPFSTIPYIVLLFTNMIIPVLIGIKYTSSATLTIPPSEAFRREE
ncbi:MAG: hypothetical protein ACTSX9_05490 [Candidatus Njordarchaeales archaeon]